MALDKALKDRLSKIEEVRKELAKAEKSAAKDIMNMLKELMSENPLLIGMRWNQYTPSFNDGDVCEFGINGPEFKFAEAVNPIDPSGVDEEDAEYDDSDEWIDEWSVNDSFFEKKADIMNFKEIAKLKKTVKDVQTVFGKLCQMDSQLQSMFGDGVQITVTAEGVESEDYDHD